MIIYVSIGGILGKRRAQQIKCPECGARGQVRIRKDGFADYKIMDDGRVVSDGFTEMDDGCEVECFECGEQLDYYEVQESVGKRLKWT